MVVVGSKSKANRRSRKVIGFLKSLFDPLSFKQTLSTALMSAGFLVWAVCVCVCVCVCPRWCQRHKTLTFPLVGITDSCYRHMENFQTEHFLKTNTKLQVHSAKSTPDPFQPGCLLRRRENSTLLVQPTLNLFFPPTLNLDDPRAHTQLPALSAFSFYTK